MIRVGVVGASGLAGGELIRLALQHPQVEVTFLGGSSNVGKRLPQLHPGLRVDLGVAIAEVDPDVVAQRCDVVFLATPAPVSARLADQLADRVACVIDLSGAFRIQGEQAHQRWYPAVERTADLSKRFVYGVPELVSEAMAGAPLISLPGCFATAITLALHPLLTQLGLDLGHVLVDGKTGSSGGGLSLRASDLHAMRDGGVTPYAPTGHRHAAEVSEFLGTTGPGSVRSLTMSAYGVSHVRGLLASCYAFPDRALDARELHRAFIRSYRGHPFVRVRRHDESLIPLPDPHAVIGSNYCDLTPLWDPDAGRLVVLAALDNLVKGAAGQAIQALNAHYSLNTEEGLTMQPVVPA